MSSFREILGVAPSTVDIPNSALVIIDAQNEYAEGKLKIRDVEKSRKVIKELLEKYRAKKGKVIHVLHQVPEGAPIFSLNTNLAKEFQELAPKDGEVVIKKNAPSSFTATELHETLQKDGIKQLVLTGYMAHVCVTGTARSAMEHGYDVVIPSDAIGDRDIPGIDGNALTKTVLLELGDAIATVTDSSKIQ